MLSRNPLWWRTLAIVAMALGTIGVVLPIVPTVPFLLLAAWAASKGWPALEQRLLNHPVHGHHIRRWRTHGAISRRAKWLATVMMFGSITMLQFLPVALWVRIAIPTVMLTVLLWLWSRPE